MREVRPDWRTIRRPNLRTRPQALAHTDGTCPHGRDVAEAEPIVLLGSQTVQEPDGTKHVDLTGAAWHPHTCLTEDAHG